ncbi:MAG: PD40 domain-containing protein [Hyphomicrobiaceae bacterium]|nr:PD40 domain-containing protein [Hyphomicrobiaceae bacterium]MCC0024925.1 PD40 domain-containing protein [Hyphomicrobiaceae bacterium]
MLQAGQTSELVVANAQTGANEVIYSTPDLIEAPNWTPDGQWLVFNQEGRLFRLSTHGGVPELIDTGSIDRLNNDHVLSPDGETVFVSNGDGHLYRVAIDGGEPARVSNDHPGRAYRYYLHGVSPDGKELAYVGLEMMDGKPVTWICTIPAAGGKDKMLTDGACPVDGPEYSPDGEWIYFNSEAAASQPGHAQLFRMSRDGSGTQQLTFDDRVNWFPHLSPDGSRLVYISYPAGTIGHPADKQVIIRSMDPNGGGPADLDSFNGGQGTINVNSWAPDSFHFAYVRYPQA